MSVSGRTARLSRQTISYVVLALFAVFYVGPVLMLVSTSFKTLPEFFKNPTGRPASFGFENFRKAWSLANFPATLNSRSSTVVATALFVVMACSSPSRSPVATCGAGACSRCTSWRCSCRRR